MAQSGPWVLAIDNGTQSVRALVFDSTGELIDKCKIPIEPYFSAQPGWAEQHPEVYWQALCQACQGLWQQGKVTPQQLSAAVLTTQRGTQINLDDAGKPLRPAIVWLDQRRAPIVTPLARPWRYLFRLLGVQGTVDQFRAKAPANWIAQHQPDIRRRTHKCLLLSGYLTYRLTGEWRDSVGAQVGYIPFDYKRQTWASPRDWKWQALAITPEQLPELVKPGATLGTITADAGAATGLPCGLPLLAAASDKACEVIGSGALTPDTACLSYGTTATVNTTSQRYVEAVPMLPPYPSAAPDAYCTEVMIYRGFWMVSWFKQEFGQPEQQLAVQQGVEPEALFDDLVRVVPPGSMGLMLQPYWSPGVKMPGPEAKGSIIGFGDVHTRAHVYRAVLEGLAYALREGKERIEARSKQPIRQLRVSGGGSQSDAAMQLTADIFNMPAERPHTYETSGLGAAFSAMVGLGVYPDYATAVSAMVRVGKVFTPSAQASDLYDRLYREVYLKMYGRLQPIYRAIQRITGYPPSQ